MNRNLGVMQGRLLPKYQSRYQAHPVGYWQDEFIVAQELGLSLIEFILDYNQVEKNPLMSEPGIAEIQEISEQTGVAVKTVCADYLMESPLHSENSKTVAESNRILQTLLRNVQKLGVTDIVIPCVDRAAFSSESEILRFIQNIRPIKDVAEKLEINLALETDLSPNCLVALLETLNSKIFTVNYDTGNSACLGYNPVEELAAYGSRISDIHLKDRLRNGPSVELGMGNTDFNSFFKSLSQINYTGYFIMQVYRDDEGIKIFKKQLEWIISRLNQY
jgi:L-ribulose-5-phosphate 3-epimerase